MTLLDVWFKPDVHCQSQRAIALASLGRQVTFVKTQDDSTCLDGDNFCLVIRDVTEAKEAERVEREQSDRLTMLFEEADDDGGLAALGGVIHRQTIRRSR